MKLRVLDAHAVRSALSMEGAIDGMKEAFKQLAQGRASLPLRTRIEEPGQQGDVLFMPAALHESGELAVKIVSVYPQNPDQGLPTIHALVVAIDSRTGRPVAILEGASLTALRTGAISGAATDLLARPNAKTAAIYGSGVQARTQLEAVCTVRHIESAWVYSLDLRGAEALVTELSGRNPIPNDIRIADNASEPLKDADIICTATTSSTPVFPGTRVRPGTHINAIGAYTPTMQEVDSETVKKAYVVVDSKDAALEEAGDLIIPIESGEISEAWIEAELGEVINGTKPARASQDQITLFKSVGIAIQDAVSAGRALQRAEELGLGEVIEL